jgi:16S rRNA (uracil1498-N3)-methyltransferase
MPATDFRSPRLFVTPPLAAQVAVPLDRDQANYLGNVLRLTQGDRILLFNGRDGEWAATLHGEKRTLAAHPVEQLRPQDSLPDIAYVFAPLKHARLDYMAQKAVEMGVNRLQPVITRYTQASRVNTERMRANVIEAAEQCGILSLAEVGEPLPLARYLAARPQGRLLVFCDEAADVADPIEALRRRPQGGGLDVLIGPEGGFAPEERQVLLAAPDILRLAIGPRILRADTAAVAALALVQAVCGDWVHPAT